MAYLDRAGNKVFAVVDGEERKKCDKIGSLIFSHDSKHLSYVTFADNKQFVVVDGNEGKRYDGIFKIGGAGITKFIFDSPDSFHYLATLIDEKAMSIYLVEETIK